MRLARVDVLADFGGAPSTIALVSRYMRESQLDPSVRLLAETIVQHTASKDTLSEILAIYYFTIGHVRYANDPRSQELVKRPELVIRQIAAGQTPSLDCDDMVTFQGALLLALGREVRAVTAAFRNAFHAGQRQYSHVYLQVREPRTSTWITLDPVAAEETGKMLSRVKAIKIWPIA